MYSGMNFGRVAQRRYNRVTIVVSIVSVVIIIALGLWLFFLLSNNQQSQMVSDVDTSVVSNQSETYEYVNDDAIVMTGTVDLSDF